MSLSDLEKREKIKQLEADTKQKNLEVKRTELQAKRTELQTKLYPWYILIPCAVIVMIAVVMFMSN